MDKKELQLDSYDRKILFELDKNARITATQIGKKIRKSKQFVDYRIKKLESSGVLTGYVTVIDYSRLGYQSIRIYFKFHELTPQQQEDIENSLVVDKEVWWYASVQGAWDVAYAVGVKNVIDFYEYWDRIMGKYRRYIKDHLVVVYTHIHQFPKSYLVKQKYTGQGTMVGASKECIALKDFDMRLLKLLSDHGRMPLLDLAATLGTSPQVARSHIKDLEEKKIIQGYRATIDTSFLGYRYYKAYINLLHTDRLKELEQFCKEHPNIMATNRTIGFRDFEIEFQATTFEEFDSYMGELRSIFAGMVDEYVFVIAREEKKMLYFPFES